MKRILVDTGHWVGAFYEKDNFKWRKLGIKFMEWFEIQDKKNSQIIITYGILTEVIARLISKTDFKVANKVLNFFLESDKIIIYNDTHKYEDEIFEIFRKYEDFTLVDAEIVLRYFDLHCDYLISTADEFNRCSGLNCYKTPY